MCSDRVSRLAYLGTRRWPGCFLVQGDDAVDLLLGGWVKQPIHKEKSAAFVFFPKPPKSKIRGPAGNFDPEI